MTKARGFTLVEMLVVITIIGILIVALVPAVRNAQVRAKETAVKTQCASIETALANFAQSHGGNYPGVALDVMAPYNDHALGDPAIFDDAASLSPTSGEMVNGVLGGYGHYNNSSDNVFQQIKTAKDTPLAGAPANTPRYFDSLMLSDAIQEFPSNPFISTGAGERARMRNIFTFSILINSGFDPINNFSPNEPNPANASYDCGLYTSRSGSNFGIATNDPLDGMRVIVQHLPMGVPLDPNFTPAGFTQVCEFGTDDSDFFAEGDFAYVPILSTSSHPFGDTLTTVENETYKWGTNVTGYILFGYGHKSHKTKEYEEEQREFANRGLPGYGSSGVDTIYENYVLQLFEGAIFYSKHYSD